MKNYLRNFVKSFSVFQLIFTTLALFVLVFLQTKILNFAHLADSTKVKAVYTGAIFFLYGGTALLGLTNLKAKRLSILDLLRFGVFVSATLLTVYNFTSGEAITKWTIFYAAAAGLTFVEGIIRIALGKSIEDGVVGYKGYFYSLSNRFNVVFLAILGVIIAIVVVVLDLLNKQFVVTNLTTYYLAILVGIVLVVAVVQSFLGDSEANIVDALAVIGTTTALVLAIVSLGKFGISNRRFAVLVATLAGSLYLRAVAYPGPTAKTSKIKINRYYADETAKYDFVFALVLALGCSFVAYLAAFNPDALVSYIRRLTKLDATSLQSYFIFCYPAFVVLQLLLILIFRKLKNSKIKLVDFFVTELTLLALFAIPMLVASILNGTLLQAGIITVITFIGSAAVAIITALIFTIVRVKHYESVIVEAKATEEVTKEENAEEVLAEEPQEEVVEEVVEEEPQAEQPQEEVVEAEEDDVVLERTVDEEIEPVVEETTDEDVEPTYEEPVEEVVEEVVEEEPQEEGLTDEELALLEAIPEAEESKSEEPQEEGLTEEELALLEAIPEAEESKSEEPQEEVVEEVVEEEPQEDGLTEEELALLEAIPEAEESKSQEATEEETQEVVEQQPQEEVVFDDDEAAFLASIPDAPESKEEVPVEEEETFVDEEGNVVSSNELPTEEELLEMQKFLDETEGLTDDMDDDEAEDEDDEEADEEMTEPEEEEVVEAEAKEKGIAIPEIQLVDEDGTPKKIKRSFKTRMMFADYSAKEYYNEIKNYLVMYRAKGRCSARCETFRYKGLVAKVALAGKSVKVCLAINPADLQGSKYNFKDVSEKKQYIEVPTMIKVRSNRGLKYFKELVDLMMAQRLVKPKRGFEPTNYLPQLIPNGSAILATIGMSQDYLYDSMNARSIPAEMPDNLEDFLPVIQGDDLTGPEEEATVYLDTLCSHFEDGQEVTIDVLKSAHIVTKGNVLRVKARGTLDKKIILYAEYVEPDALKMLMCTNCTVVKIVR